MLIYCYCDLHKQQPFHARDRTTTLVLALFGSDTFSPISNSFYESAVA